MDVSLRTQGIISRRYVVLRRLPMYKQWCKCTDQVVSTVQDLNHKAERCEAEAPEY